jgi:hypothetical protein
MTTVDQLNSVIERYLRISTTRYLEVGAYETASEMLDDFDYECVYNFIEYELIFKIAYCWSDNIYDIGTWQTNPMFRLMYNTIINNSTLILHMSNFINTERTVVGITVTLSDYSPLNVLRHYAFYYARKLDKSFFMQIFVEYFRDIQGPRHSLISGQNLDINGSVIDTHTRIPPPA